MIDKIWKEKLNLNADQINPFSQNLEGEKWSLIGVIFNDETLDMTSSEKFPDVGIFPGDYLILDAVCI